MLSKREIRVILLHEFKLGHNAAEAARNIIRVWGEGTTTERTARRWFEQFRKGDFNIEDKEGRGRSSEVDDHQLKAMIEENPSLTCRLIAEELQVHHTTVFDHLKKLGKVKKLGKWVPHELNDFQKNRRFDVCSSHLLRNNSDPFLHRIVTCDEKWIVYDNRRRSAQWLDRDEKPKHFPKPNLHQKKVMVTVWWYKAGMIHYSFLKPNETINSDKYCSEIDQMNTKLKQLCPRLVNKQGPILLHDNAKPHTSLTTKKKLFDLNYEVIAHPPYSPDLSPTDFHFFKHLDNFLTNKQFKKQDDIENAFVEFLASKNSDFYLNGINMLVPRWQKCIEAKGAYFD